MIWLSVKKLFSLNKKNFFCGFFVLFFIDFSSFGKPSIITLVKEAEEKTNLVKSEFSATVKKINQSTILKDRMLFGSADLFAFKEDYKASAELYKYLLKSSSFTQKEKLDIETRLIRSLTKSHASEEAISYVRKYLDTINHESDAAASEESKVLDFLYALLTTTKPKNIKLFLQAIGPFTSDGMNVIQSSKIAILSGDLSLAEIWLNRSVGPSFKSRNKEFLAQKNIFIAFILMLKKDYHKANDILELVKENELNFENAQILNYLKAICLKQKGEISKALTSLSNIVKTSKIYPRALTKTIDWLSAIEKYEDLRTIYSDIKNIANTKRWLYWDLAAYLDLMNNDTELAAQAIENNLILLTEIEAELEQWRHSENEEDVLKMQPKKIRDFLIEPRLLIYFKEKYSLLEKEEEKIENLAKSLIVFMEHMTNLSLNEIFPEQFFMLKKNKYFLSRLLNIIEVANSSSLEQVSLADKEQNRLALVIEKQKLFSSTEAFQPEDKTITHLFRLKNKAFLSYQMGHKLEQQYLSFLNYANNSDTAQSLAFKLGNLERMQQSEKDKSLQILFDILSNILGKKLHGGEDHFPKRVISLVSSAAQKWDILQDAMNRMSLYSGATLAKAQYGMQENWLQIVRDIYKNSDFVRSDLLNSHASLLSSLAQFNKHWQKQAHDLLTLREQLNRVVADYFPRIKSNYYQQLQAIKNRNKAWLAEAKYLMGKKHKDMRDSENSLFKLKREKISFYLSNMKDLVK